MPSGLPLLLTALLALCATSAAAQRVELLDEVGHPAADLLQDILIRERYQLLTRDTVLPSHHRAEGDLVVLDADVRLEGRVAGDVAVVGGALWLRPGSAVGGTVATLGGHLGRSALAQASDTLKLPLYVAAEVSRSGSGYQIRLRRPPPPSLVELPGLLGLGLPTYDRVDGLTLPISVRLRPGGATSLTGTAAYRSARGEVDLRAEFATPIGRRVWWEVRAYRATVTNDAWIRGDLVNSLAALLARSDVRNYHRAEAAEIGLRRRAVRTLLPGESFVGPFLTLRAVREEGLEAREPWSLYGDEWRPNPPVLDASYASLTGGAAIEWRGQSSQLALDAEAEWAPPSWGDLEFLRFTAHGRWAMQALWGHRIAVRGYTLLPVGGTPLPPQRWSFVGGPSTLPTLATAALRGDHVALVKSTYSIPLPRPTLPLIGPPRLQLLHAVGSAWRSGTDAPPWEQNLGVGLLARVARLEVWVNPAAPDLDPHLGLSAILPF